MMLSRAAHAANSVFRTLFGFTNTCQAIVARDYQLAGALGLAARPNRVGDASGASAAPAAQANIPPKISRV
jgi:hypothetical protein